MTIALMEQIESWMNAFSSTDSLLDTVGPANIVESKPNVDCNKAFIPFGSYALVYIGTNNTLEAWSVPVIALNTTNDFGGYYFLSLETGKHIRSKQWDVLQINDSVIHTVNTFWDEQNQPTLKNYAPLLNGILVVK